MSAQEEKGCAVVDHVVESREEACISGESRLKGDSKLAKCESEESRNQQKRRETQ